MDKYSGLFKQTCNFDQGCGAVAQAILDDWRRSQEISGGGAGT